LKLQRERLKRAMRTYGPPIAPGAKRAPPLDLSAVAGQGVKEVLRAALNEVEASRARDAAVGAPVEAWTA
jgi:hypothetical protein